MQWIIGVIATVCAAAAWAQNPLEQVEQGNPLEQVQPPALNNAAPQVPAAIAATAPPAGLMDLPALLGAQGQQIDKAAAPKWLRPGVRITYASAAAPGGAGLTQVNIVGMDPQHVVIDLRAYNQDTHTKQISYLHSTGFLAKPGYGGWWMEPGELKSMLQLHGKTRGLRVQEVDYDYNDKKLRAIRIEYDHPRGECHRHVYDMRDGQLLRSVVFRRAGGRELVSMMHVLVHYRDLKLPWAHSSFSPAVQNLKLLEYSGDLTISIPDVMQQPNPLAMNMLVLQHGGSWLMVSASVKHNLTLGGLQGQADTVRAFGAAQIGGLWIDPQILARLQQDQLIDDDVVSKVKTSVSFIGADETGRRVAVVSEISELFNVNYSYDLQSGMMVSFSATRSLAPATETLTMKLIRQE